MNIELVAREVTVTPDIQERIEKKIEKMLEHRNKDIPVRVMISESRGRTQAQITLAILGKEVVGAAEDKSVLTAFDAALDKADRQIKKVFEKVSDKR
jgi:ribosomal subunit interface protein